MNNILKVCIGIVVVTALAIFVFKVPANSILFYGVILLCPLMHLFMMHHGDHSEKLPEDHSKH